MQVTLRLQLRFFIHFFILLERCNYYFFCFAGQTQWFQLYVNRNKQTTHDLVKKAEKGKKDIHVITFRLYLAMQQKKKFLSIDIFAHIPHTPHTPGGIKALCITVDAPQLGRREKDMRNKFTDTPPDVQRKDSGTLFRFVFVSFFVLVFFSFVSFRFVS